MLTWENTPIQGTAAIMEKLQVSPQASSCAPCIMSIPRVREKRESRVNEGPEVRWKKSSKGDKGERMGHMKETID